jgi:hypothetical protein
VAQPVRRDRGHGIALLDVLSISIYKRYARLAIPLALVLLVHADIAIPTEAVDTQNSISSPDVRRLRTEARCLRWHR